MITCQNIYSLAEYWQTLKRRTRRMRHSSHCWNLFSLFLYQIYKKILENSLKKASEIVILRLGTELIVWFYFIWWLEPWSHFSELREVLICCLWRTKIKNAKLLKNIYLTLAQTLHANPMKQAFLFIFVSF